MNFNTMNFIYNLKYMASGMVIILLVMAIIIACTILLNKLPSKAE